MGYLLIDGRQISVDIKEELQKEVDTLKEKTGGVPTLAVVLVGSNPASAVYVSNKQKACEKVGIRSQTYHLPDDCGEDELIELIGMLNNDGSVNGILVQLPLPKHINEMKIIELIRVDKDVDGFHPINVGLLSIGAPNFVSCTPAGIMELLKRSNIALDGKHCVIIGRSNIVSKPMAMLMLAKNATVTICHSHTVDLSAITRQADILVAAVGKPHFVKADMVKPGVVIIDVGINRQADGKITGDVDFDAITDAGLCSAITPVPRGVGPMTIAMLLKNCVASYKNSNPSYTGCMGEQF